MADTAPIGSDSGTLAPQPDSALNASLSDIDTQAAPAIAASRDQEQAYEQKSLSAADSETAEADTAARELSAEDEEMQHWIDHTPTRQAAYATSMHAAPIFAILTALGGKATRLNGMQMLAATNGIVSGLNESSEKKYNDAMTAWNAAYEKMRDHQRRLTDLHKIMMDAYRGRSDAYQKAVEAARRQTGDILDDAQRKKLAAVDAFKAQAVAVAKAGQLRFSYAQLHERALKDIAQEAHWKEVEKKTSTMPPEVKAQIAAEGARRQNAKAQKDANLKVRGQVSGNLTMPEEQKTEKLKQLDDENAALTLEENRAISNADAILAGYAASKGGGPSPGATPPAPAATPPADPRHGAIQRPGQPTPTQPPKQYTSADEVRTDVASGLLTKDQAKQILVHQFGYN